MRATLEAFRNLAAYVRANLVTAARITLLEGPSTLVRTFKAAVVIGIVLFVISLIVRMWLVVHVGVPEASLLYQTVNNLPFLLPLALVGHIAHEALRER